MMFALWVSVTLGVTSAPDPCYADAVASAYARADTVALERLYVDARTRSDSLLALYRLYPIVIQDSLLEGLPTDLDEPDARDLALLSALWSYRMADVGLLKRMPLAFRVVDLLNRAMELDDRDPFVRLIAGQHYLYRPRYAGGDPDYALRLLEGLRASLREATVCGGDPDEVDVWIWFVMHKSGKAGADDVRSALLARSLPATFRQFVREPPP